ADWSGARQGRLPVPNPAFLRPASACNRGLERVNPVFRPLGPAALRMDGSGSGKEKSRQGQIGDTFQIRAAAPILLDSNWTVFSIWSPMARPHAMATTSGHSSASPPP